MIMNKSPKVITSKTASKKYIIAALALVIILILDVYVTGFMKFGYNVVRCGNMPVAVSPPAFGVGPSTYELPGDYVPGWADTEYVCSEKEALDRSYIKRL